MRISLEQLYKENPVLERTEGYNVSDRYNVINSMDVINQFTRYGFELSSIESAGVRSSEKVGAQSHMIRMRSEYVMQGGLKPEVIIHNSYDGTKALNVRVGYFRMACSNGLVTGQSLIPNLQIRHSDNSWEDHLNEFIDGYEEKFNLQKLWVEKMEDKQLTLDEAYAIAERAVQVRHSDRRIGMDIVDPLQLLLTRRREDKGNSAWITYNKIQESLSLGLFDKYSNEGVIKKAKVMTNIDEIIRMNVDLSDMFEEIVV